QIKHERRMHPNSGMQAHRRLPRSVPDARDEFPVGSSEMQRHTATVASQGKSIADHAARFDLQPFQGTVDITHRAARSRFLGQHMPRLERRPQFYVDVALRKIADAGESKLKMRCEPTQLKWVARGVEVCQHVPEICFAEVRQHPTVMD